MKAQPKFSHYHYLNIALTLLLLWNALVWVLSDKFYLSAAREMIKQETALSRERADDLTDSIQRNFNYLHGIPDMLTGIPNVKLAVAKFGNGATPSTLAKKERMQKWSSDRALAELNQHLDMTARSLQTDMLAVSNAARDLIAASNWKVPATAVGLNIADRNFFKQNRDGKRRIQYAVGKATNVPGLYFSAPITIGRKFMGATIAKVDIPNLSFLTKQINAFIADDNGVIILSRDKSLEMHSLPDADFSRLSHQEKSKVYLQDIFPVIQIAPWDENKLPSLVRIQNGDVPHLLVSKRLPEFNMTVYVDSELDSIPSLSHEYFLYTLALSVLGSLLIVFATGSMTYFLSLRSSREMLWNQANFDTLTGLPNRDLMRDRLIQEIRKSDRSGLPLGLILIDLDQFKDINDTMGHDMGDILLEQAAQRISKCVRNSDTVARLGGDEFIVVLPQLSNIFHIENIAHKIIISLAEPFQLRDETSLISASMGITLYPNDASNIDDLLKNADQAMYVSKKNGRNRFSYFTPALQEEAQSRQLLIKDLRGALSGNQLKVYFQPIVDMSSGHTHKAEALLRWIHPVRGMVSPVEFIPLAEETKLIIEIGAWVRKESAIWCKRWNEICNDTFQISINRSPVEFMDESRVASVTNFIANLSKDGLAGENFVFEITEGMLLNVSSNVGNELLSLRDAGIQVSLDDFGTGYSSLSYLNKLDIDYLKIDRSFVCNLEPDSDNLVLCEAIISMAHKLGLKVIAEGVETEQQRDLLFNAHCDYAQGYLFSRPLPPEEFELWIRHNNSRQISKT